jgi:hypothetical protein
MNRGKRRLSNAAKRRTTLTLPAESLTEAERIARARRVNLSTVISEALAESLRQGAATERGEQVLRAYQKAFSGFSADEAAILDGIILEPKKRRRQ